jgi:hypothetical protein
MNTQRKQRNSEIRKQALQLLGDPQYLFRAGQKLGDLGVVGEERNRLVLFLAGSRVVGLHG